MKRLLVIALICVAPIIGHGQHNTYYIGHSGFGWECIVGEMVNDLATDAGITTYGYNYQFIGGSCLSNQWINHASPQVGTDSHVQLPTGNYDVLVLAEQIPISEVIDGSPWGCSLTSYQSVDSFYDMAVAANAATRIYLMEFHNEVNQTLSNPYNTWDSLNTVNRPLWERVADSVSSMNPGGPQICLIPVAEAFQAMADSVRNNQFPGITNWINLFDPNDTVVATIHPTEETYYLVACVHYAAIFGQSPVGLTNQTFHAQSWAFDPPTPTQANMMQRIAWHVVSNDPRSCMPTGTDVRELGSADIKIFQDDQQLISTSDLSGYQMITMYDMFGKQVAASATNRNGFQLEVSGLAKGLYVYSLSGPTKNVSGKVLIR